MGRSTRDYIIIGLKGMGMGAADVVPGVSGGTIAFISGIYVELLTSISNVNFGFLKTLKKEGFKVAWKQLNCAFLASLFLGICISIVSLAKTIKYLLENEPILLWSFFFGLVVASIIFIGKHVENWNYKFLFLAMFGVAFGYIITITSSTTLTEINYLFLVFAGAIASCAMILPGISGSFILVLLGAYKPVLNALNTKDFVSIIIFLVGAVLGLLSFSRILKWLFSTYKNYTLATLTGFIIGSLNKIWPWKETISWRTNSKGIEVPFNTASVSPFSFEGDNQLLISIFLMLIGFGLIILLEKLAIKKD